MTDSSPIIAASKQDAGSTSPESTPPTASIPGAATSPTSDLTSGTGSSPSPNTGVDLVETVLNRAKAQSSASASSNEVPPDEVEIIVKEILESKKCK